MQPTAIHPCVSDASYVFQENDLGQRDLNDVKEVPKSTRPGIRHTGRKAVAPEACLTEWLTWWATGHEIDMSSAQPSLT
jgi:hypothetical protein